MPTAVVATVRAIAQAHAAFSSAAFGTVLLADSGIESQSGNRPNNQTEQSDRRNELGHRCLPSRMRRHPPWLPPLRISTPKWAWSQIQLEPLRFQGSKSKLGTRIEFAAPPRRHRPLTEPARMFASRRLIRIVAAVDVIGPGQAAPRDLAGRALTAIRRRLAAT